MRVILVSPMNPVNLGATARVAANFGLAEIGLVAPRCSPQDAAARMVATPHAQGWLESMCVFPDLRTALGEAPWAVAFTRRTGDCRRPTVDLAGVRELIVSARIGVPSAASGALVFGPEDTGLHSDDVGLCSHTCALPTDPQMPSMNLSHAVAAVLARTLWSGDAGAECTAQTMRKTDPHDFLEDSGEGQASSYSSLPLHEFNHFIDHWRESMVAVGMVKDGNPERLLAHYRRIFLQAGLTSRDVQMLRGFLSHIIRVKRGDQGG